jgi:hypothetical protein
VQRGERLRGVVNLRKHFRINMGVQANTIDGIEVKTNVWALFTLGQPANVIKVAYFDGDTLDDLCVLQVDPKTRRIMSITNELDRQDKQEIHEYAQQYLTRVEPNALLEVADRGQDIPPYHIDPERIFAAVYSQARNVNNSQLDTWIVAQKPKKSFVICSPNRITMFVCLR